MKAVSEYNLVTYVPPPVVGSIAVRALNTACLTGTVEWYRKKGSGAWPLFTEPKFRPGEYRAVITLRAVTGFIFIEEFSYGREMMLNRVASQINIDDVFFNYEQEIRIIYAPITPEEIPPLSQIRQHSFQS
jgi:hypothetical protein